MRRVLTWVLVAAILVGAADATAVALGAPAIASGGFEAAAWIAIGLVFLVFAPAQFFRPLRRSGAPLFAPAAGAFVTAVLFTFDSYYAPSRQRYLDDVGGVPWWLVGAGVLALVAGAAALRARRSAMLLTDLAILALAVSVVGYGSH